MKIQIATSACTKENLLWRNRLRGALSAQMYLAVSAAGGREGACPPEAPPNPFRWFDSSPEVIRLVVMMYIKYLNRPGFAGGPIF